MGFSEADVDDCPQGVMTVDWRATPILALIDRAIRAAVESPKLSLI
jgi:hypothetical protein